MCFRLSILAAKNEGKEEFVGVSEIVKAHWAEYGRNFYSRYDYEGVEMDKATQLMEKLTAATGTEVGKAFGTFAISNADEFSYTDPVTQEVVEKQGIRFMAEDGSRFVFRLSGTSSANGAHFCLACLLPYFHSLLILLLA